MIEGDATWIQLLQIVLSSFSSIIVAAFGVIAVKKEKQSKKEKDLETQLIAEKEKSQKAAEEKRDRKLDNISNGFDKLSKDVVGMREDQEEMKDQLKRVANMTEYSLKFSTEINNALLCLSDRIIDESSDDALRKTMQQHRKTTSDLLQKLYEVTF